MLWAWLVSPSRVGVGVAGVVCCTCVHVVVKSGEDYEGFEVFFGGFFTMEGRLYTSLAL